jgi:membrane fusion protein, multidrug efflux system
MRRLAFRGWRPEHTILVETMDRNNRKLPVYLAIAIVVGVSIWMLTGLGSEPVQRETATSSQNAAPGLPGVRTQTLRAQDVSREIRVTGRTEANRILELRAETDGMVVHIDAERGASVAEGATIVRLDLRDREARLRESKALVNQREIEHQAISNLRGQQFTTDIQIAEALASLEAARSALQRIEIELDQTRIKAPFAGVIQERNVEIGDFVRVGDTVGQLVDMDPIIVIGEINEREIAHVRVGSLGRTTLVDGTQLEGNIRYISRVANDATRTFKVELAIANPDNAVRAGLTAELRLFADTVRVHTLSSAMLSLADDGTVGVKVVENNRARFFPVQIVGSSLDGMHVTGLPESIELITVGQGFVTDGQEVRTSNVGLSGTSGP